MAIAIGAGHAGGLDHALAQTEQGRMSTIKDKFGKLTKSQNMTGLIEISHVDDDPLKRRLTVKILTDPAFN